VPKTKTEEFIGFCMKCRKKRRVPEGLYKLTANGRAMLQGPCRVCQTTVSKMTTKR
jgi:hypothetical protein